MCHYATSDALSFFKPISVKMNSGQMHLNAADHMDAAVLVHMVRSTQMHLTAVIFNQGVLSDCLQALFCFAWTSHCYQI